MCFSGLYSLVPSLYHSMGRELSPAVEVPGDDYDRILQIQENIKQDWNLSKESRVSKLTIPLRRTCAPCLLLLHGSSSGEDKDCKGMATAQTMGEKRSYHPQREGQPGDLAATRTTKFLYRLQIEGYLLSFCQIKGVNKSKTTRLPRR